MVVREWCNEKHCGATSLHKFGRSPRQKSETPVRQGRDGIKGSSISHEA